MVFSVNGLTEVSIGQLINYKVVLSPDLSAKLSARDKYRASLAMEHLNRLKDDFVEHLLFTYNYDDETVLTFPMLSSYFRVYLYNKATQTIETFRQLNILLGSISPIFAKGDKVLRPLIDFYNYVHNCM